MNEIEIYSQPSYSKSIKLSHLSMNHKESTKLKFRFRSKPSDTAIFHHNLINHYSEKKFGIPIRNLFFTYVYSGKLVDSKLRVIPLGDNVRYFYHPEVDDMTVMLIEEIAESKFLKDVVKVYNLDVEAYILAYTYGVVAQNTTNINDALERLTGSLEQYTEDYRELAEVILGYVNKVIRTYVDNVIEVKDIEKMPEGTDAEIMVYAPDDIYLWKE